MDADRFEDLARQALLNGTEEEAAAVVATAAAESDNARLWQWLGLLHRSLDEHEAALHSFEQAARLAPADPGIAHGHARVALEAGLDAERLFEHARRLDPQKGEVLIGLTAARMAEGHGEQAEAELASTIRNAPLWMDGHRQLAQLRCLLGRSAEAFASVDQALTTLSDVPQLWKMLFDLHIAAEDFAGLREAIARAQATGASPALIDPNAAIAAAELGCMEHADELFAAVEASGGPALSIWRIRHLIRTGRAAEAIPLIDAELKTNPRAAAWSYAATAWRLTGDNRLEWLESDGQFVSVIDLADDWCSFDELAEALRSLHIARGTFLDQSVRGGTQTDGALFSRIDPQIRALRAAVVRAVKFYISKLPPVDDRHPLLSQRRDRRVRFGGSWSVRLSGAGYHANHVHPHGWISSALYVALPPCLPSDHPRAGWLTLGQPPVGLGVDLGPTRQIQPKRGQLVLFPSWMWHGTLPFAEGERLTVAFDVAPAH